MIISYRVMIMVMEAIKIVNFIWIMESTVSSVTKQLTMTAVFSEIYTIYLTSPPYTFLSDENVDYYIKI